MLLLTVHHIVFDGWSLGIFLKELNALTRLFPKGGPPLFRSSPPVFRPCARANDRAFTAEVLDELISFWRKNLEGIPPHLALPFDHPLQSGRNYRGGRHPLVLGEELTAVSQRLCSRDEGATLYMTLLAGLAALLYRYTGQSDIVIGARRAARMSARTRRLIGNFVNTLVLRTDVSAARRFAS